MLEPPSREDIQWHVGTAGDHIAVHQMLTSVFHAPSRESFLGAIDHPFYEPNDRLLARRNGRPVAHVQLCRREVKFDGLLLPATELCWLGTLPELRQRAIASDLVAWGERQMLQDGALVGMLSTSLPHFFHRRGWAVCGRHCFSEAGAHELLAYLSHDEQAAAQSGNSSQNGHGDHQSRSEDAEARENYSLRPWRQVELPALMNLHAENTWGLGGTYHRSEAYWRWLISRRPFHQILVAIDGPNRLELDDSSDRIAGYAITRDDQILELMASPEHPRAARHLLRRICGDLVERNGRRVVYHGPPNDPIHAQFEQAGGTWHLHEAFQRSVFMAKVLDPEALLKQLIPVFKQRAEVAGIPRPSELGLAVDQQRFQIVLTPRSIRLTIGSKVGRSYLSLSNSDFTRLLLGHLDVEAALDDGRLKASTRIARQLAVGLFPQQPLWRAPLDDPTL